MLIIDPGSTADRAEAFAWADAVVGHLCDNEDVKDSILMVLLMPVVRLTFPFPMFEQPLSRRMHTYLSTALLFNRVFGVSLPPSNQGVCASFIPDLSVNMHAAPCT